MASDDMASAFTRGIKRNEEATYQEMQKKLKGRMEKEFRPEFLNRLDDIIVFRSLTKENLKQIVNMELAKVSKRLLEKGLKLEVGEDAKDFLIEKGSSLEFGARPLRRSIEQHLEDMLAEEILKGTFHGAEAVTVRMVEADGEKKLGFDVVRSGDPVPAVAGPA